MDLAKIAVTQFLVHLGLKTIPEDFLQRHKRIAVAVFFVVLAALMATLFTGCSTNPQILDKSIYYLNDMDITVNGLHCTGVCTVPAAPKYVIVITSKQDMDQLVVSTISRTETYPAAIQTNWLKPKRSYTYTFVPSSLEVSLYSPLAFGGFDKGKGQHSWALVFFQHKDFVLLGGLSCNAGPSYGVNGVASCQEMQGQKMQVWFGEAVRAAASRVVHPGKPVPIAPCTIPESNDGGFNWVLSIPDRECRYVFETNKKPYRQFLLFTIGAEEVPVRGL